MRARQRHFNPRFVGASLVLDSRYINQSDNTSVSSWADRSGNANNADQATAANQPSFQTAEQGGNGIVYFDGSDDQLDLTSNIASVNTALFVANERTAPSIISYLIGGNNVGFYLSYPAINWGLGYFDGSVSRVATYASGNIRGVYGVCYLSGSKIFLNSREVAYAQTNTPSAITISRIGNRTGGVSYPSLANVGSINLFTSTLSDSSRKRCEHAAAFSFKIACN
jgi:hypothetical protein